MGPAQAITPDTSWGDKHEVPQRPELAKRDSDGPYCYHVQRRVSAPISRALATHLKPNVVTGLDLLMGALAALLLWRGHWLAGIAMIQLFGVFSCVDGEVARTDERLRVTRWAANTLLPASVSIAVRKQMA